MKSTITPPRAIETRQTGVCRWKLFLMVCLLIGGINSYAQYSTFSFTSYSPGDGPVQSGNDFCYATTDDGLNYTHCGGTGMPSYYTAGAPKPQFRAYGYPMTTYKTMVFPFSKGTFLTYGNGGMEQTCNTIQVLFDLNYLADCGGFTVYQQTGSSQSYTAYFTADHFGEEFITMKSFTVPNDSVYQVTVTGTAGTALIWIIPNTPHIFGVNHFLLKQPCTVATAPTISATSSSITYGGSTTLSISAGTLNNSTEWKWYSGSCGGTLVGTGTSISVSPTITTTYYARGEGGICGTNGNCGSKTITVAPCTSPTVPTISATSSTIGWGSSTTLSISAGNLNNATAWKWYSGSCGGTLIGTGTSITVSPTSTTTYYARGEGVCITPGSCGNKAITVTAGNITWTGAVSDDFSSASNWTPSITPSGCLAQVVIPSTSRTPVVKSDATVASLQLENAATLSLAANLNLCGNLTGAPSTTGLVTGTGNLILAGSSSQQVSGKIRVNKLRLNNSAGAVMQSDADVQIVQALELRTGNFNASTGTITFKSTSPSQCAILDNFSSGFTGTFTGNITAERYYNSSNTFDQHFMGSPVNSPTFGQWGAEGTSGYVTPTEDCDEKVLAYRSPYGTIFSYDESQGSECSLGGWYVETSGNAQNGVGYSIVREGSGVLSLSGEPNLNSTYSVSGCTNTNWSNTTLQGNLITSGWRLVSNPYLATLSLNHSVSGFDNQVQVWHAQGAYSGSYQPLSVGSNATIAPFQAFMVHKSSPGGSATYTLYASDRTTNATTFYKEEEAGKLEIIAANTTTGLLDKTTVAFNSSATAGFDVELDANKFSGALNRQLIYTTCSDGWMSCNTLNSVIQTPDVTVYFAPGTSGSFKFSFEGVNTFDPTQYITLEDKKLNIFHNVRSGDYSFTSQTSDTRDRFVLHFTPAMDISTIDATCDQPGIINIEQEGTPVWSYEIQNATGRTIGAGLINQREGAAINATPDVYTLTLTDANNYSVVKRITVEGSQPLKADLTFSRDVVRVNEPVLLISAATGADTYTWDFGDGAILDGQVVNHEYENEGTYVVKHTASNSTNCTDQVEKTITVTRAVIAGINDTKADNLKIWGHDRYIFVDFSPVAKVNATISIVNVVGQKVLEEKYAQGNIYQAYLPGIAAGYVIVKVTNNGETSYKKVMLN